MRSSRSAAIGVVAKGVNVETTLSIGVVAGDVPSDGSGSRLRLLLEGDGTANLGVTSENGNCKAASIVSRCIHLDVSLDSWTGTEGHQGTFGTLGAVGLLPPSRLFCFAWASLSNEVAWKKTRSNKREQLAPSPDVASPGTASIIRATWGDYICVPGRWGWSDVLPALTILADLFTFMSGS